MKKRVGLSLMITGLILLLFAAGLLIYNNYENAMAEKQSSDIVQSLITVTDEAVPTEDTDRYDTDMRIVEIDGYGYVGYLSIPELDIKLPVMDKWDYTRLKVAPCRYYGSSKSDNLVIAAHNYRSHFGYIGKLSVDSVVLFTDMDGLVSKYTVTGIETLRSTDVEKVKDVGDDLILYTCTYSGRSRVVVRCSKVD